MKNDNNKTVLTVTGSDSTSESGVQADIVTITSLGGRAVSAITSITVQNTIGIQDFYDLPTETVAGQIEAIVNDVQPQVVKIGMLRNVETVNMVAEMLRRYNICDIIYDPIIVSTHGDVLMSDEVIESVKRQIFPLCQLVMMKSASAEHFIGERIATEDSMIAASRSILSYGCKTVLLQGKPTDDHQRVDIVVQQDGTTTHHLTAVGTSRSTIERHGISGNLSSAIATFLCQGHSQNEAINLAYNYINKLFETNTGLEGRASELYNEFTDELSKHYFTNSDVAFYADKLNVSSRYLAQVARRMVGKTPKTIIDEYLYRKAEQLLNHSDKTIQEIAYALGFNSQAHFTKFFRKQSGRTPSDFRRKNE